MPYRRKKHFIFQMCALVRKAVYWRPTDRAMSRAVGAPVGYGGVWMHVEIILRYGAV
jgi:hypothetical protein